MIRLFPFVLIQNFWLRYPALHLHAFKVQLKLFGIIFFGMFQIERFNNEGESHIYTVHCTFFTNLTDFRSSITSIRFVRSSSCLLFNMQKKVCNNEAIASGLHSLNWITLFMHEIILKFLLFDSSLFENYLRTNFTNSSSFCIKPVPFKYMNEICVKFAVDDEWSCTLDSQFNTDTNRFVAVRLNAPIVALYKKKALAITRIISAHKLLLVRLAINSSLQDASHKHCKNMRIVIVLFFLFQYIIRNAFNVYAA